MSGHVVSQGRIASKLKLAMLHLDLLGKLLLCQPISTKLSNLIGGLLLSLLKTKLLAVEDYKRHHVAKTQRQTKHQIHIKCVCSLR